MANWKKLASGAAGAAGGAGLDVSEVFSTHLYKGSSSSKTINNGIDLSTEGGLVWIKKRTDTGHHQLLDTERGANAARSSSQGGGDDTSISYWNFSFNTNGFGFNTTETNINSTVEDYCSWTFRKHPKFFDVQTFTTTYNNDPNVISHDLESELGAAFFYQTGSTGQGSNWIVWHRSLGTSKYLKLNQTSGETNDTNSIEAVDNSAHTISFGYPMSTVDDRLVSGSTETTNWVGYFFAHNDGDGEFGPDGDQDIIKCGQYTGNHSTLPKKVTLGFEPQWVLIKKKNSTSNWAIWDVMRGMTTTDNAEALEPNTNTKEADTGNIIVYPVADGFEFDDASDFANFNSNVYVYIAIRKGPMSAPTSASEVFAVDTGNNSNDPAFDSGFPVDFAYYKDKSNFANWIVSARKIQKQYIIFNGRNAFSTLNNAAFDYQEDWYDGTRDSNQVSAMWRCAPEFFDVQTWKVDGTGDQTIKHNLGVVPEMVWHKNISDSGSGSGNWWVAHKDLTGWDSSSENDRHTLILSSNSGSAQQGYHRDFTSTQIRLLSNGAGGFTTSHKGIAFLFASLSGISKVGSYTGNGSNQNIDCGFSAGAKWVMIKSTGSGNWHVFDTDRGITSGQDNYLQMNGADPQETKTGVDVDPLNSGFTVDGSNSQINASGTTYIFYAIAA